MMLRMEPLKSHTLSGGTMWEYPIGLIRYLFLGFVHYCVFMIHFRRLLRRIFFYWLKTPAR